MSNNLPWPSVATAHLHFQTHGAQRCLLTAVTTETFQVEYNTGSDCLKVWLPGINAAKSTVWRCLLKLISCSTALPSSYDGLLRNTTGQTSNIPLVQLLQLQASFDRSVAVETTRVSAAADRPARRRGSAHAKYSGPHRMVIEPFLLLGLAAEYKSRRWLWSIVVRRLSEDHDTHRWTKLTAREAISRSRYMVGAKILMVHVI